MRLAKKTTIEIDTDIYPLAAVQAAAYIFLRDNFIRIEKGEKPNIVVVKVKSISENIEDEFFNELLHETLRFRISENAKGIRERLVIQALSSASRISDSTVSSEPSSSQAEADVILEQEIEKLLKEAEEGSYKTDPLKISVPWEESENACGAKKKGSGKKRKSK
ncbi:MAG: hypothetical protein J5706_06710 [Elusimicrobiales bacterium]|nr:hypothetical protein [Elusimicrobiales bacterium]